MGCCGGGPRRVEASADLFSPYVSSEVPAAYDLPPPRSLVVLGSRTSDGVNSEVYRLIQSGASEDDAIAWFSSTLTPELEEWGDLAISELASCRLVCVDGCAWSCRLSTFAEMGGLYAFDSDPASAYRSMMMVWTGQRISRRSEWLRRWRIRAESAIRREVSFVGLPWSPGSVSQCQHLGRILHREPCSCGDDKTVAIRACHSPARIKRGRSSSYCVPVKTRWDLLADPLARRAMQCCESCPLRTIPPDPASVASESPLPPPTALDSPSEPAGSQ